MHTYFVSYRSDTCSQRLGVGDGIFELPRAVSSEAALEDLKKLIPAHHHRKYGEKLFGRVTVVTLQHLHSRP